MKYREAGVLDIAEIQRVRRLVKENILTDPERITYEDCKNFITLRGKGWVCEFKGRIIGFAIADLKENNIWALFIEPNYEGKGIGANLHNIMLNWYFSKGKEYAWLSTTPGTRAEGFYKKLGWVETGIYGEDEIKFEMKRAAWFKNKL